MKRDLVPIDDRVYLIRDRGGDYFRKWEATGWETVKRFAIWTKSKTEAARYTLEELNKAGFIELVCGFSGLALERVK